MKAKLKKSSAQKGKIQVIAVIAIVIGIIGLASFVLYNRSQNIQTSLPSQIQTSSNPQASFGTIEGSSYTFYYPLGYENTKSDNDLLNYKNKNTKALEPETIFLRVEENTKPYRNPTYDFCAKIAEGFRIKKDDQITAEVASGNIKGKGCTIKATSPVGGGVNDSVVTNIKYVWDDKGPDYSIYKARAM